MSTEKSQGNKMIVKYFEYLIYVYDFLIWVYILL